MTFMKLIYLIEGVFFYLKGNAFTGGNIGNSNTLKKGCKQLPVN